VKRQGRKPKKIKNERREKTRARLVPGVIRGAYCSKVSKKGTVLADEGARSSDLTNTRKWSEREKRREKRPVRYAMTANNRCTHSDIGRSSGKARIPTERGIHAKNKGESYSNEVLGTTLPWRKLSRLERVKEGSLVGSHQEEKQEKKERHTPDQCRLLEEGYSPKNPKKKKKKKTDKQT